MATMVGRPAGSKNKPKGEEKAIDKYMVGGEEAWKSGVEKIIAEIREMRGEMESFKEQLAEERRAREEERRREKEEWIKEKRLLEERIATLEWINEKKERDDRKNRIIIKGVKWRREGLEKEVIDFIKDSIKVNIGIKKAWTISTGGNKNMAVVEVDSWEQKRDIMSKKKELEKDILIEDDLTRKEREIQWKLREMARGEREKGMKNVKVGYKKIRIEDKWFRWNEREDKLQEERRRE